MTEKIEADGTTDLRPGREREEEPVSNHNLFVLNTVLSVCMIEPQILRERGRKKKNQLKFFNQSPINSHPFFCFPLVMNSKLIRLTHLLQVNYAWQSFQHFSLHLLLTSALP